jgi:RNA polymerase sigma-70 factor (ECF subfamily)
MNTPLSAADIVVEHAAFVWRARVHLGVSENQLKDVSQEVFLTATRKLAEFEGRSSLRTWLYGICRNLAADARRRQAQAPELMGELPESILLPAQEGALWAKRAHAQLVRALGTLADERRLVFILFEIEQLTMEEIAEATGAPRRTCYARLEAAREHVRAELRRSERPLPRKGVVR